MCLCFPVFDASLDPEKFLLNLDLDDDVVGWKDLKEKMVLTLCFWKVYNTHMSINLKLGARQALTELRPRDADTLQQGYITFTH
jgi:hypothetical protein